MEFSGTLFFFCFFFFGTFLCELLSQFFFLVSFAKFSRAFVILPFPPKRFILGMTVFFHDLFFLPF